MRRAAGLSPEPGERSSRQVPPRDPHHPKAAGSRRPCPPPPESGGCQALPAQARCVTFEDEVMPPGRPLGRVPLAKDGGNPGVGAGTPTLASPRAVPDYVARYPAIRCPRQRECYKGVFQDQLAEYTELLGDIRATRRGPREPVATVGWLPWHATGRTDRASQRCRYLKQKLTHIKARIQEYDRDATVTPAATHPGGR